MRTKYLTLLILFSFIILYSCEKIIDINISDKDKKIVINSIISTDSLVKVNVSKSLNILDDQNAIFLNDAVVNLYEDGNFIEQLPLDSNGTYKSKNFYPLVNKKYKIEVSCNGLTSVSAENKIPQKVPIISIDTVSVQTDINNAIEFTMKFTDPVNDTNYYFLEAKTRYNEYNYFTGELENSYMSNLYIYTVDNIVDVDVNQNGGIVFTDNLINGQTYSLKFNIDKYNFYNDTNKVYFYLNSVSKDFYLYIKSYSLNQENMDNPFAEPVQVYENIKNGYGIFAGFSSYKDSINVIGQELEY